MFPRKILLFTVRNIYTKKIPDSKQDLDYIIPKGIGQTSLPYIKYIF
jgi:hypothetical protein